jgi:hypothetical protein
VKLLVFLGAATVGLTAWLGGELDPADFARPTGTLVAVLALVTGVYVLAAAWALRVRSSRRAAVLVVLAVAVLARLALVGGEPALSNDAYRYVWDGRVQAHGINPYRWPPADPALAALRDEAVWARLNRPAVRTAYPPVAEGLFAGLYRLRADSVAWTKLALTALDLVLVGLLAALLVRLRRPPERVLLYAWNPLVLFEVAGAGHVEVVAVLLLVLALAASLARRPAPAGALLAAAALVKPYAAVAGPALARGRSLAIAAAAFAATVAAAYLPYLDAGARVLGYVPGYLREEGFTSGYRFYLLGLAGGRGDAATVAYAVGAAAVLLTLAIGFALRPPRSPAGVPARALALFVVLWVLASPTYPWYALTAVALLPLARGIVLVPAAAIVLGAPFLYLHISVGAHPAWPRHLAYGSAALALAAAAAWSVAQRRAREPADAVGERDARPEPEPLRRPLRRGEHVADVAEPELAGHHRLRRALE